MTVALFLRGLHESYLQLCITWCKGSCYKDYTQKVKKIDWFVLNFKSSKKPTNQPINQKDREKTS